MNYTNNLTTVFIKNPRASSFLGYLVLSPINHFDKAPQNSLDILDFAILACGWIYFTAWVVSCYPQLWINYKRKSVVGLSFNYLSLNILGHGCYSVYNVLMYFIPSFRDEYLQQNPNTTIPVFMSDVGFSLHTFIANVLTGFQCLIYERGGQSISLTVQIFISLVFFSGSILTFLVIFSGFSKLFYANYYSTVKLIVTIIKCTPQAWFNYRRKSTVGWSISGVNLDLTGAVFSLLQLALVAYKDDDWHSFVGNFGKLGLGLLTLFFDILFFIQHYCLYTDRGSLGVSRSSLIPSIEESVSNEANNKKIESQIENADPKETNSEFEKRMSP